MGEKEVYSMGYIRERVVHDITGNDTYKKGLFNGLEITDLIKRPTVEYSQCVR